jgi:dipeptidyl aminopeptidase/acylaminoacyl peptidase
VRHFSFCCIVFLFAVLPVTAQQHPFTFEDMMKLKRVEEPMPSPDGRWVLFAAVDVDLAANTKTPHVWIVPTAGGPEKEIIGDQDADRPRWAPDGKRFAFISTKKQGAQVWIADFDGDAGTVTGVHILTVIASEASGELWSPDGKNILFTSDVYPECDGGPYPRVYNCNLGKMGDAKNSKVKAQIFTQLLYRHWDAYKDGKRSHIFVIAVPPEPGQPDTRRPTDHLQRDLTPGDFDSPAFSQDSQDNYAFSPDGQEICYTSNHDPMEAASTNKDLWIVPLDGGPAKNITADNKASDSSPLYSPDGKYIAYRAQQRPGYESDRFRLMLYDRKAGTSRDLTENMDAWVDSFAWSPDSKRIAFVYDSKGQALANWFEVDRPYDGPPMAGVWVNLPKPTNFGVLLGDSFNDNLAFTNDGKTLLFDRMSVTFPNEIFKMAIGQSMPEPLTRINASVLGQVELSTFENFWFTGALDDQVQAFMLKPPKLDGAKKYPVKLIVHGGPEVPMGNEWSFRWNANLFAASGYVVLIINFHGSPGYGQKFIDDINGEWGGAPFEDLLKGLDYAEKIYPYMDKNRECALGASYGGYMINWILGHTDRFKCLVAHDGMFNTESAWGTTEELWFNEWEFKGTPYNNRELYRKWSPHLSAANFKTPTLVIHSQRDYRLDVSEGLQLFTTLQRRGVPSKMLYFPDEGHWILRPQNSQLWYKTVNDWVDQWTGKN